jgi:flavodoxin
MWIQDDADGGIMKTAIVYYSFDGNSARTAEILEEIAGRKGTTDTFEIKLQDTKKRTGFFKYLWGGLQALTRKKPAIESLDFDAAAYDTIILGGPVWAASPAPPLVSFLDTAKLDGKRIALFLCHAGGKGAAMEKLRALLGKNKVAGEIDMINPGNLAEDELKSKLSRWVESLD